MTRTTFDLDDGVLEALKERRARERKPLGVIASELLAAALAEDAPPPVEFAWVSRPMGAAVDLEDRDAVWDLLDRD